MKTDKKSEHEITSLKQRIETLEGFDPLYMGEELKDLHHKTTFVHTRLEESLGHLLVRNQLEPIRNLVPQEVYQQAFRSGTTIATEVPFYKKVEMTVANKQIDGKLGNKIMDVNNTRKYFAHPVTYQDNLQEFKQNRLKYKQTLEGLSKAYDGMSAVFAKLPEGKAKTNK